MSTMVSSLGGGGGGLKSYTLCLVCYIGLLNTSALVEQGP
jgi:hypothetical protein